MQRKCSLSEFPIPMMVKKFNSVMGIKTSKKDKELHGYGIKSIRHMVESVDGDFEIHTKEKWFVADVVIPLV